MGHSGARRRQHKQSQTKDRRPRRNQTLQGEWGGGARGGVNPGEGERDVPDPSRTHPVTARREEEERKGRIRREDIQGKETREERREDKFPHADIPATQGRRIYIMLGNMSEGVIKMTLCLPICQNMSLN